MTATIIRLIDRRRPARPRLVGEHTTPAEDLAYALGRSLRAADVFEDVQNDRTPSDTEPAA